MEYIIGGYSSDPKIIKNKAIEYFEKRYSKQFEFEGVVDHNFIVGIIRDRRNQKNKNIQFFNNNKIFKSLFYQEIPDKLKEERKDFEIKKVLMSLNNDFIIVNYENEKYIEIYKDIFAREKIYYTTKPPYLFSTSFKFLISILDKKIINYNAFSRYMGNGLNIGEETVIFNIKRLDIGEFLHISKNKINVKNDWIINKGYFIKKAQDFKNLQYWTDYIYDTFKETLEFPNDRPILSMMSGGLDSTIITSIFSKEFDIPIEALTIHVPNYNEEEVEKAIEIAEYIDIPHFVKTIRIPNLNELKNSYAEIFNILEEPMGGTAYFSRFFSFQEVIKLNRQNVMLGEGAGEVMSYLRHNVIKNFKYTNKIFHIPLKLRSLLMNFLHKLYYPSFYLTNHIKSKNFINSLDIIMNSNFLQTKTEFQTFLTSVQFCNLKDIYNITNKKVNLDIFFAANTKKYKEYPFNNFNKYGYHLLNLSPNGDPLISHVLSSYYHLKLYCPYITDKSFRKFLPIPPYLKFTGKGIRSRYKWLVREVAKRKKLLPEKYFEWKPKYGLRQEFFTSDSFNSVKSFALQLIDDIKTTPLVNIIPFERYFKRATLKNIIKHSSEYMKFNIWLGFLGWLSTI